MFAWGMEYLIAASMWGSMASNSSPHVGSIQITGRVVSAEYGMVDKGDARLTKAQKVAPELGDRHCSELPERISHAAVFV